MISGSNVEGSKNFANRGFTFSQSIDPIFDDKIAKALCNEGKSLTGITANSERINVYINKGAETVAGAICYINGKILWCDSIYVEKAFQNKGFGRQLVNKLLELALSRNFREVQLNTYFPDALAFFKKCGFEEVAAIPNWKYELTCYLMKKRI